MLARQPGMPRSRKTSDVGERSSARPRLFVCRGVGGVGCAARGWPCRAHARAEHSHRPSRRPGSTAHGSHSLLGLRHAGAFERAGWGGAGRVGRRAGRSASAETCRNPLFGLFRCRYPCRLPNRLPIRGLVSGSKRQPRRAHSSSKHGRLHGSGADAVWRQKRIRHGDCTCARRGPRSRCGLFLHVPIWHPAWSRIRAVAAVQQRPPQHDARPRLRQGQHPRPGGTTRGRKKRSDLSADLARAPPSQRSSVHRVRRTVGGCRGGELSDQRGDSAAIRARARFRDLAVGAVRARRGEHLLADTARTDPPLHHNQKEANCGHQYPCHRRAASRP